MLGVESPKKLQRATKSPFMARRTFYRMAPTLPSIFSTEINMKRAKRYAARAMCVSIHVVLTPIAIVISPFVSLLELGVYFLDSLEAIANDE